jgi:cytochrome c peroxidase
MRRGKATTLYVVAAHGRWRCALVLGVALLAWPILSGTQPAADASAVRPGKARGAEPISPIPQSVALDPQRAALGERLFNDTRLSGDNTRSCATCHALEKGGVDGKARGTATDGQARLRNTPTLFNVAFNYSFNWDGATATLEAHAGKLLTNPNVMNAQWPQILSRLRSDKSYSILFSKLYSDGVTQVNVLDALAHYERSLITPNARFDRYLRGEREALTREELAGYQLFKSYGCVACHQGANIGGNLFQRFGVFQEPPSPNSQPDVGRFRVTSVERDRQVFRVPSLRNVAHTAPYFHDGRAPTLEVAVDTMAKVQLGRQLAPDEVQSIVRFLHTLTGEYQGKSVAVLTAGAR